LKVLLKNSIKTHSILTWQNEEISVLEKVYSIHFVGFVLVFWYSLKLFVSVVFCLKQVCDSLAAVWLCKCVDALHLCSFILEFRFIKCICKSWNSCDIVNISSCGLLDELDVDSYESNQYKNYVCFISFSLYLVIV